jgi:hypothetical protein
MMDPVSRRQALGMLSAPVAVASMAGRACAADGEKDDPGEHLVVGPFQIDGWFLKTVKKAPLGGPFEPLSTPRHSDLAKALADCRVYVLDRRVGPNVNAARFAKDDYPKVVAEGPLGGEWQDGKQTFVVAVAAVTTTGVESHYEGKGPPYRVVEGITVTIRLWGRDDRDVAQAVYHFSSDEPVVAYDITGVVRRG